MLYAACDLLYTTHYILETVYNMYYKYGLGAYYILYVVLYALFFINIHPKVYVMDRRL